jgi:hypothetical protein
VFTARRFLFALLLDNIWVGVTSAFSDCSPKIANKGHDVFDTPALALSHPLHPEEEINEEEKTSQPTPDIVQDARQETEDKGPDVVPQRIPQEKVNHNTTFNPTGNYRLSPPFERSFIDLGRLMVEEGFDLPTYTQVQDLLSEDWKFVWICITITTWPSNFLYKNMPCWVFTGVILLCDDA